jgi:arsenate reductase (thioredoxin)
MAASFARRLGGDHVVVHSAGSEPAASLNAAVVEAMREKGIELDGQAPQRLTVDMAKDADVVVTMGCGDTCPVYPGKGYLGWELADPSALALPSVRPIRDEIEKRVRTLIVELIAAGADRQ